jgi:WD40 repeat protein
MSSNWSPCIQTIEGYEHAVGSVAISPDNTMLAAVAYGKKAKVWDLISGVCLHTFETELVMQVVFSPRSSQLALVGIENVEIWDLVTGTHLKTMEGYFQSVSFCADGTHLALMGETSLEIHNLATSEDFHTHTPHPSKLVLATIFPSDCAQLNSKLLNEVVGPHSTGADPGAPVLTDRIFHAKVVVYDPETDNTKVLDLATGRCLQVLVTAKEVADKNEVALSSDGMRLALVNHGAIDIWDLATGNCLQRVEGFQYHYKNAMTFSADGLRLASTREKEIKIWDIATGRCLQTLLGHTEEVYTLAFSPDSVRLASGSRDCTIKIWDLAAKSSPEITTYSKCQDRIGSIALSPNGRWIALGSHDKTIRIWDTATRTFLRTMKMTYFLAGITFSPDSMQLATAEGGYSFRQFRDHFTGAGFQTLKSSTFSPSSTQPVSRSPNGFIKIWDLTSGTCLHTIGNDRFVDLSIDFSTSDTTLGGYLFSRGETYITVWGLVTRVCPHENFSDPTDCKLEELDLHRSKQMEMPFVYSSQGRQLRYNDELPLLSLSKDKDWILKSGKPLLWLPPDCRPQLDEAYADWRQPVGIYKNHIVIVDTYNNWLHFEFNFGNLDN